MIVGFDPVAAKFFVENAAGAIVFEVPTDEVLVKHYRGDGILFVELQGEAAVLVTYDLDGRPQPLALAAAGVGSWLVTSVPG